MLPDPPSLTSPLRGSLFCITIQEKMFMGPRKMISRGAPALLSFGPENTNGKKFSHRTQTSIKKAKIQLADYFVHYRPIIHTYTAKKSLQLIQELIMISHLKCKSAFFLVCSLCTLPLVIYVLYNY